MNLKRILVLIMLASLVICTACSKKTVTKTNITGIEPTEVIDEKTGEGELEDVTGITSGAAISMGEEITGVVLTSEGIDTTSEDLTSGEIELENQESKEAYERFLNNEEMVYFDRFMLKDNLGVELYETGKEYTLSDVLDVITASYYQNTKNTKINSIDHSYIDCGKDGVNELVLRFNGMDYFDQDDSSTLVYIMKYIDGKLTLCYSYQTWARCEATVNEYGYYESMYYGGAHNCLLQYGVIDKAGNWKEIVSIDDEDMIDKVYGSEMLDKIITVAETKGISHGIVFNTIEFEDNIDPFYTFYVFDDQREQIEDMDLYTNSIYKEVFDEAGVPFITPDEVDTMIADKEEKVGATEEIKAGAEITWKVLDVTMFSDYVGRNSSANG